MTRIIAGSRKGTRLDAAKGDGTRPTTDRVREALYSWLSTWFDVVDEPPEHQLDGVAVLDLFAGTGALGLEAASRGAQRVLLVDHRTAPLIRANAARAKLQVEVRAGKAETVLGSLTDPFDLVLIDPPYALADESVDRLLHLLATGPHLAPGGLVVLERSKRSPAPVWSERFTRTWSRRYGEAVLHMGALDDEEPG